MPMTLLSMLALLASAPPHGGEHGHHGNPGDMDGYIARMEEPSRDAWQKPDDVVRALGLSDGKVACDVGAGPGYFSLRLARAVGPAGRVYAVDVEPRMLAALVERMGKAGVSNITPVMAADADTLLPPATCDVVLVVDTYHHFPDRPAYLGRLKGVLKPGGSLVIVDFHKKAPMGPPPEQKLSREEVLAEMSAAGWKLAAEQAFLPHQYFLVMKPG